MSVTVSETISFSDFQKMDIRMGRLTKVEKVEGADKLIKMQVDFGAVKRQIIAGIAEFYDSEELTGKECPFLFNLEPKKFMGHESHGMLLAIDVKGDRSDCVLLHPNKKVSPGAKVV